jgi:hypothetical protein
MARSTNPNWTQTAGQLCHSAARELGAIGLGEELASDELAEMVTRLNSMLGAWSIEGNLFREASASIVIAAGAGAATLPSDVRDVRSVGYVESADYTRPLQPFNRDEYMSMPNRSQQGTPTIYYYSQQLGGDQLYLWPVNTDEATLELDYSRQFFFIEAPDQELDLPAEWHQAALYGLASRCAGIFGTTRLDPAAVSRCDTQSRATYDRLLDADRPDSYTFYYDTPVTVR